MRFTNLTSTLSRSLSRLSRGSALLTRSTPAISHSTPVTERPLYFAITKKHAREAASSSHTHGEKGSEMIDKLEAALHKGTTPTIITAQGTHSGVIIASSRSKIFNVKPATSWIDKLAQEHGSPSCSPTVVAELTKTYKKRELVLKSMQDSYTEIILPLAKDKGLLEDYINYFGGIRLGKILEDLDAMSGAISYKHCDDGRSDSSPLTIVTASVDRIDFLKPLKISDLRLSGHVTFVGYSSMEVFMKMEEISLDKPEERGDTILVARFTMVARDAVTGKAAQVNPMLLQSDAEKKLFQMGEDHKARKRLLAEQALTKSPPTEEERFLIHDLYLEYSKYEDFLQRIRKPDDVQWMSDTKMSAIQIMQPQDRNIHDKIFGGYLMRLAFELAYCNASVFSNSHPTFLALDDIAFRKPVPIGTLLALDSQIAYSEGGEHHSFQVMVKADILDVEKGTRVTTNTFWFTFSDPRKGKITPKVLPRTYAESMLFLEGKRRRIEGAQMSRLNRKNLGME